VVNARSLTTSQLVADQIVNLSIAEGTLNPRLVKVKRQRTLRRRRYGLTAIREESTRKYPFKMGSHRRSSGSRTFMMSELRRHLSLTTELLDHHGSVSEGTRRQFRTELFPGLSLTTLTSALESPVGNLALFPQAKLPETIVLIHPATATCSTLIH
jgi:hypothetical protein